MAYEIREQLQCQVGTRRRPKYEVYDLNGSTTFEIDSGTFRLLNEDMTEVLSGNCVVNNSDTDAAGNSIKTIQLDMDLRHTDIDEGYYVLTLHVYLTNGEDDMFRAPVEITDFEEE